MATYHLSAKVGKVGTGAPHADYIMRTGRYAAKSQDDLEHAESGNLPDWAAGNPRAFWEAADLYERKNGYVYREFEVALPRELDPDQRLALVREFVEAELGNNTYTFAIHNPKAAIDGGEQPHAHIMYSERIQDGIERTAEDHFKRANKKNPERGGCAKESRFGCGKGRAEIREALKEVRENWANIQNRHLETHGHVARVDHRTLKEQGIDPSERVAEPKLGPQFTAIYGQDLAAQRLIRGKENDATRETLRQRYKADQGAIKGELKEQRLALKEKHAEERRGLSLKNKEQRQEVRAAAKKSGANIGVSLSLWAFEAAKEREAMQQRHAKEREALNPHAQRSQVFKDWLEKQATQGDETAQAALRAINYREQREKKKKQAGIEGAEVEEQLHKKTLAGLSAEIDAGRQRVIYKTAAGVKTFTDTGPRIEMHDKTSNSLEAALRLAAQKYGGRVELTGSKEFKMQAAEMAGRMGIKVANPELQEFMRQKAMQEPAKPVTPPVGEATSEIRKEAETEGANKLEPSNEELEQIREKLRKIRLTSPREHAETIKKSKEYGDLVAAKEAESTRTVEQRLGVLTAKLAEEKTKLAEAEKASAAWRKAHPLARFVLEPQSDEDREQTKKRIAIQETELAMEREKVAKAREAARVAAREAAYKELAQRFDSARQAEVKTLEKKEAELRARLPAQKRPQQTRTPPTKQRGMER